jgi:hypothetical protein
MDSPDPLPSGQYVIYALIDPTDEKVYYVGQTRSPQRRLEQHLGARHHQGEKGEWLRRLKQKGAQPLIRILETVTGAQAALEKEQEWIRHFLKQQMPLCNAQAQPKRKHAGLHPIPVAEVCRIQTIIAGAPPVISARLPDGRTGSTLRSLCKALDLDRYGQAARIKRDPVLAGALVTVLLDSPSGQQQTQVLLSWAIPIWLSGLNTTRLSEAKHALALHIQQKAVEGLTSFEAEHQAVIDRVTALEGGSARPTVGLSGQRLEYIYLLAARARQKYGYPIAMTLAGLAERFQVADVFDLPDKDWPAVLDWFSALLEE